MGDELAPAVQARRRAAARMRRIVSGLDKEADGPVADGVVPAGGRLTPAEHWRPQAPPPGPHAELQGHRGPAPGPSRPAARRRGWLDRGLLTVEVLAVVGLVGATLWSFGLLRSVQRDMRPAATPRPTATTVVPLVLVRPSATAVPAAGVPAATELTPALATTTPFLVPATPVSVVTITVTVTPSPTPTPVATPDSPTGVRFTIPAIGVDAPMVEGDSWDTLKYGIGHRIGTAWPGENGNVVISAHNDVYGAIFKDLSALKPGDLVIAATPTGVFRYEVASSRIVLPSEVSVTKPTGEPILTMISCYPLYVDTHRIVVTARLVQ